MVKEKKNARIKEGEEMFAHNHICYMRINKVIDPPGRNFQGKQLFFTVKLEYFT